MGNSWNTDTNVLETRLHEEDLSDEQKNPSKPKKPGANQRYQNVSGIWGHFENTKISPNTWSRTWVVADHQFAGTGPRGEIRPFDHYKQWTKVNKSDFHGHGIPPYDPNFDYIQSFPLIDAKPDKEHDDPDTEHHDEDKTEPILPPDQGGRRPTPINNVSDNTRAKGGGDAKLDRSTLWNRRPIY